MSQSLLYHAFGVREGYEYQKTDYVEGRVEFHLRAKKEWLKYPECGHVRPFEFRKPDRLLLAELVGVEPKEPLRPLEPVVAELLQALVFLQMHRRHRRHGRGGGRE